MPALVSPPIWARQIRYVLVAPAGVWPLASLLGVPLGKVFTAAPPAPKGELDARPQGSPNVPPAPNTCCRFRNISPRFGARVARLKPPRNISELLISTVAFAFQVNVSFVLL